MADCSHEIFNFFLIIKMRTAMFQNLMNFFASSRGVDVFWSPLAVTVIGGIFLAIILKDKSKTQENNHKLTGSTIGEVTRLIAEELDKRPKHSSNTVSRRSNSNRRGDDNAIVFFVGALFFLAIGYAKHQNQVLDYSVIAATSLFGFWMATLVFSLIQGTISGTGWTIYAFTVSILSLLALPILYLSLSPLYAPDGIINLQQVAIDRGLIGLIKEYRAEGMIFLVFQVMGFAVLYGSWIFILLTLVHMTSSTLVVTGVTGRTFWLWLSIRTSKFANPVKATLIVTILYVISFVFISGLAYEWWRPANSF